MGQTADGAPTAKAEAETPDEEQEQEEECMCIHSRWQQKVDSRNST